MRGEAQSRRAALGRSPDQFRGAAARARRSLIASPRPSRGIGITAMRATPARSSARKCENRLAAASIRSPRGREVERRRGPLGAGRRSRAEREQGLARPHLGRVEPQRGARRVVRRQHAGRERRFAVLGGGGRLVDLAPERPLDRLARNAAGAQQRHAAADAGDDRRLDPDGGRPAVEHEIDAARRDRPSRDRRWWATRGPTGWPTARPPARRTRAISACATGCAGTRTATVSRPAVARSATGQVGRFRQDEGQRPRPERGRERVGRGVEDARARARPPRRRHGRSAD